MTDKDRSNSPISRLSWIAVKAGFLLVLPVLNACGFQESVRPRFTPSPTSADISPSNTEVPQVDSPGLPGHASPTSLSPVGVAPSQTPTPPPTPNVTPVLTPPLPGWIWYQSPNLAYLIAYPQSWTLHRNPGETGAEVRERVSFRSPETGSEVTADVWDVTTPDFDLLNWINLNPERALYERLEEPVWREQ